MSGSLNRVELIGNLGADPEIRRTQDGRAIANLRIATSETWRDKTSGERRERVEWHTVVIFTEGLAKIAEQYTRKGSKVFVAGKLATRKWQDRDGNDRYSTEVVLQGFDAQLLLLGDGRKPASEDDYGTSRTAAERSVADTRRPADRSRVDSELDDDIPF
jgi:single-strand DNA-binding protein